MFSAFEGMQAKVIFTSEMLSAFEGMQAKVIFTSVILHSQTAK